MTVCQVAKRALIVEDEPMVRLLAVDLLEGLGFEAIEAASAAEALAAIASKAGDFAFAMIDLGLPDDNGFDLFGAMRRKRVNLPLIIATGLDIADLAIRFDGDAYVEVLTKPYTAEMLRAALKALGIGAKCDVNAGAQDIPSPAS